MIKLRCECCRREYPLDSRGWQCACGGLFELTETPTFSRSKIDKNNFTLWRYRNLLPIKREKNIVSLGEGLTPLVQINIYGLKVLCKLEFIAPTGSFKDRGTAVLVSALKEMGVKSVVEDSSGNAAASLAAYCAKAGIACKLFVPAHASPPKLRQIEIYGAKLARIEGPREKAAKAAQQEARRSYYASHYYNPFVLEGLKTFAYEICEQLGWQAPDHLIFPTGHGTFLIGAYRGFKELKKRGLLKKLPKLHAIQAEACAPLYAAFAHKTQDELPSTQAGTTVAEGISIVRPVRWRQILKAIWETAGTVGIVSEEEILHAQKELAHQGLYVEPTAAVAVAFLKKLKPQRGELILLPLTGSGLKSVPI